MGTTAGRKLTPEHRAKIGEAARSRYLKNLGHHSQDPDPKRCSKCSVAKPLAEFYWQSKRLKSGLVSRHPRPDCKECTRQAKREQYARLKAENPALLKARKQKWHQNADRKKRQQRDRENAARRRREEGRPIAGPRNPQSPRVGEYLPIGPMAEFLEREHETRSIVAIAAAVGLGERRIKGILDRESQRISLRCIDQILTGAGVPHLLHDLYPLAE